jgi:hypothetical protein
MPKVFVNLTDYSPLALITFGIGCLGWAVVYGFVIADIRKNKRIEIPIAAVMGNFAWEVNWGLIYRTDMGFLFQAAYFIWFFLDCYIVWAAFKYGRAQMVGEGSNKYFNFILVGYFLGWFIFFYFFIPEYDDKFGALTGWLINTHMSILYIYQKLKQGEFGKSKLIAILKFLSTGICVYAAYEGYPTHHTLMYLCAAYAIADIIYIAMVYTYSAQNKPERT